MWTLIPGSSFFCVCQVPVSCHKAGTCVDTLNLPKYGMKYFQLFRERPPDSFILQLLQCYGLNGLDDNRQFTKSHLHLLGTVSKLEALLPHLYVYYVPCKAKIYLDVLTPKRCITILWQFLRFTEYGLERIESFMVGKKVMVYRLRHEQSSNVSIHHHGSTHELFR